MIRREPDRPEEFGLTLAQAMGADVRRLALLLILASSVSACQRERTPICNNGLDCGWVGASADYFHGCAIREEGTAWCWGDNSIFGRLGDGTTSERERPVRVAALDGVVGLSTGRDHTCAVLADASLWCWGGNTDGQVGDGTTEIRLKPVRVPMQAPVLAVHAIQWNTFALLIDGTVWRWGAAFDTTTPRKFTDIDDVVVLADRGGCAVKSDSTAWCWGDNSEGQLGNGTLSSWSDTPVQVSGLSDVVDIDQGEQYACALTDAAEVWCWGANDWGQLGDGTTEDASVPVKVALDNAASITVGNQHACAIVGDGSAYCWGKEYLGAYDDGNYQQTLRPVRVAKLQDVVQIHAPDMSEGPSVSYAITADGTLWGWGSILSGYVPLDVPESEIHFDSPYNPQRMWVWEPFPLVDP